MFSNEQLQDLIEGEIVFVIWNVKQSGIILAVDMHLLLNFFVIKKKML
ncbi:hypothetical protein [Psychrobacillus sp.]|nr:hypothetical protein [Psychrobacillus sp.]